MTRHTVDVAIVGAGITGLSVAWHLRAHALRTVVFERSGVAAGASGVQPGGVRQQWGTEINCRLARESVTFWSEAQERLEASVALGFRSCGYLFVAHSAEALDRLRMRVDVQNAAGVPSRIVSPHEAGALVPGLDTDGLTGGAWCAEDGYFDRPQAVVESFARGTEIEIATVVELKPERAGWALQLANGTRKSAGQVLVAAGSDAPVLLRSLGVDLPIEPERRWLFFSDPIRERLVEPLVVSLERGFAAKQLGNGRVLASDLSAVGENEQDAAQWLAAVRGVIRELLPVLEYVDFTVLAPGVYDVTPDRQPILGGVSGHEGLWIAAGFSGHGFMLAPAVGRILADALSGGPEDEALRVLDLARFAERRLVPEPAIV